jgi:hypothetical protein
MVLLIVTVLLRHTVFKSFNSAFDGPFILINSIQLFVCLVKPLQSAKRSTTFRNWFYLLACYFADRVQTLKSRQTQIPRLTIRYAFHERIRNTMKPCIYLTKREIFLEIMMETTYLGDLKKN